MRRTVAAAPLPDALIAVALLAVRLVTLGTGLQPGGGWTSYLLSPCWMLPLAWRSRYPLAVAAAVAGADLVDVAVNGYHDSVPELVALLLVQYSLGAHAASTRRLVTGEVLVLGVSLWSWLGPQHEHSWNLVGDVAIALIPMVAGLYVRQQRLRAAALERLAEQLAQEREERARTAVAEERSRIARELHDEIAHAMSVIAVQADAAEGALARDPALVQKPLVAIRDTARAALVDMRSVLGALRDVEPAERTPGQRLARADDLVEQARASGLDVGFRVEGTPTPLSPRVDLAAYRVLQEALTNVRKHAGAARVDVLVRYDPDAITVQVDDDGDGSGTGGGTGQGLSGIGERVTLLGGELTAGARERGFSLHVWLPRT